MTDFVSTPGPVPAILLEPFKWANELQNLAKEYEGLPEYTAFNNAARRMIVLGNRITQLESFINGPEEPVSADEYPIASGDSSNYA
jgi:hypothetical protein